MYLKRNNIVMNSISQDKIHCNKQIPCKCCKARVTLAQCKLPLRTTIADYHISAHLLLFPKIECILPLKKYYFYMKALMSCNREALGWDRILNAVCPKASTCFNAAVFLGQGALVNPNYF